MMRRSLLWLVSFEAVFMPALSPSMETGTIVEWKKKVGDLVNENDVFCTIQTDKAVVDYTNTFDAGYLAKIYCGNGQTAPVSKTIAVMVSDAADVAKADEFKPEEGDAAEEAEAGGVTAEAPAAAAVAAAPASAKSTGGASSTPPDGVSCEAVFMPALSPSMETGTIVEWKKKVGDLVNENDVFCTIQTDKAVVDYTNTFDAGYLAKIYCGNGQTAPVSKTIGMMVSDAADIPKVENYYPEDAVGAPEADATPAPESKPAATVAPVSTAGSPRHYGGSIEEAVAASGPSVIRIAAGLPQEVMQSIAPSGRNGRYLKSDFAGRPGFDYNAETPALAMQHNSGSAKSNAAATATPPPVAGASNGGIYEVVLKPSPVYKSVSDTPLLKKLISTMHVPKAKKAVAK